MGKKNNTRRKKSIRKKSTQLKKKKEIFTRNLKPHALKKKSAHKKKHHKHVRKTRQKYRRNKLGGASMSGEPLGGASMSGEPLGGASMSGEPYDFFDINKWKAHPYPDGTNTYGFYFTNVNNYKDQVYLRIEDQIGSGASGRVFKFTPLNIVSPNKYVLKVLKSGKQTFDPGLYDQLSNLPGIVKTRYLTENMCMLMQADTDLEKFVYRFGRLTPMSAAKVVDVYRGYISELFKRGKIFFDLKMANCGISYSYKQNTGNEWVVNNFFLLDVESLKANEKGIYSGTYRCKIANLSMDGGNPRALLQNAHDDTYKKKCLIFLLGLLFFALIFGNNVILEQFCKNEENAHYKSITRPLKEYYSKLIKIMCESIQKLDESLGDDRADNPEIINNCLKLLKIDLEDEEVTGMLNNSLLGSIENDNIIKTHDKTPSANMKGAAAVQEDPAAAVEQWAINGFPIENSGPPSWEQAAEVTADADVLAGAATLRTMQEKMTLVTNRKAAKAAEAIDSILPRSK
jgi:hypothetical protein